MVARTPAVPKTGRVHRNQVVGLVVVACAVLIAIAAGLLWRPASNSAAPEATAEAVILIPGYGGDPSPLDALRERLAGAGYHVVVLDIGTGTDDLRGYADDAAQQAQSLLDEGAPAVSSVGFSAGGLIGRIAADVEPGLFADVISLAAPHDGTAWALLGGTNCPTACQQMQPGSELLASLPDAPDSASWLSLYSTTDEVIVPVDSSALAGATVAAIQQACPGTRASHGDVPADPWVIDAVSAFLAEQSLPVACPS